MFWRSKQKKEIADLKYKIQSLEMASKAQFDVIIDHVAALTTMAEILQQHGICTTEEYNNARSVVSSQIDQEVKRIQDSVDLFLKERE